MLVGYSLAYSYLSADKWIAVDVFGVKLNDERSRKISNETGLFWDLFSSFFLYVYKDTIV